MSKVGRGNGRVPVQYHQFDVSDEDGPTGPDLDRGHNGLVRVADGVITVPTGIHTGEVDVTVTLHETEPAPDRGNWRDVLEVSAHSASGDLMVRGMMDDLDEELPVLSCRPRGPGPFPASAAANRRTSPTGWRSPLAEVPLPGDRLVSGHQHTIMRISRSPPRVSGPFLPREADSCPRATSGVRPVRRDPRRRC